MRLMAFTDWWSARYINSYRQLIRLKQFGWLREESKNLKLGQESDEGGLDEGFSISEKLLLHLLCLPFYDYPYFVQLRNRYLLFSFQFSSSSSRWAKLRSPVSRLVSRKGSVYCTVCLQIFLLNQYLFQPVFILFIKLGASHRKRINKILLALKYFNLIIIFLKFGR